jgi:proteic killer suppression protein
VIVSFNSEEAAKIWAGEVSRKLPQNIQRAAQRKMEILNAAVDVTDLRTPPGNRLEALKRDRTGQYSIRINDQWRICFAWRESNAHDVEIVDYH